MRSFHPPPQSSALRGRGTARRAVEGACGSQASSFVGEKSATQHAPSTALTRGPPPPHCVWGRMSNVVLAARFAPEFYKARSPDEAERNPGTTKKLETLTPDYAALHPGYKKGKRNAGRRMETLSASTDAARPPPILPRMRGRIRRGRSPVGVPPRLLPGGSRPFRSAPGQASWDAARAHDPKKPAPTEGRRSRAAKRALPAPACPSPGKAPPTPAVIPARMMPGAARERSVSPRARAPLSLRFREYPRPKASPR
jgi:hypothetical protein